MMDIKDKEIIVSEVLKAIDNNVKVDDGRLDGAGLYPVMWVELMGEMADYFNTKYLQEDIESYWIEVEYHGIDDLDNAFCITLVGDANTEYVATDRKLPKKEVETIIDYFEKNIRR